MRYLLISAFLLIVKSGTSQTNDAGAWQDIQLEKKFTQQWNLHFTYEGRLNQNISNFYYAYGDLGLGYKVNKHVHLMLDYVFLEIRNKADYWSIYHQAYFAVSLRQKLGRFSFCDRIMPQIQYASVNSNEYGRVPNYQFRNKATIKYNYASPFTYYIACEINFRFNSYYKTQNPDEMVFARVRYFAGFFYALNKVNQIEFYYLIQKYFNINNPVTSYIIGIGYEHTFY